VEGSPWMKRSSHLVNVKGTVTLGCYINNNKTF
jgi:hypothetical protein